MQSAYTPSETWRTVAQWTLPMTLIGLIAIMVIPLPSFMLDLLLSLNISLSMIVLLSAVYFESPTSFSAFPSALLLLTVFRLGLNIATTRRILLHGPEGSGAAGNVIEAMEPDLQEGRSLFQGRIDPDVAGQRDFLRDELLRVARERGMS